MSLSIPHTPQSLTRISIAWIDINLTVTPDTIPLIFSLLSDLSTPIRLGTCSTLSNILSKGLKVPEDKLRLIQVLSLGPVLDQLEASTKAETRGTETLESYREGLARVANTLGMELVALCNDVGLQNIATLTTVNFVSDQVASFGAANGVRTIRRASPHRHAFPRRSIRRHLEPSLPYVHRHLEHGAFQVCFNHDKSDII
jgi:hypothetical protein